MRYPGLWKVKGFLTITAFERTVGSKSKPLPEVKNSTGNHIDGISFPTFKLKNFSYTGSDLGSLLTMYNPSMTSNISKVSKDKLDNAKVSFNRLDVNLNGFYGQEALKFLQGTGFGYSYDQNLKTSNQDHGHKFARLCSNLVEVENRDLLFSNMENEDTVVIEPGAKYAKVQNWIKKYFLLDWGTLISKSFPDEASKVIIAAYR